MEILRWEKKGIIILQLLRRVSRIENAFQFRGARIRTEGGE